MTIETDETEYDRPIPDGQKCICGNIGAVAKCLILGGGLPARTGYMCKECFNEYQQGWMEERSHPGDTY